MSTDSLIRINEDEPGTGMVTVESLIREHYQVIYRYAFRLAGNACDAEDLTQQCFLTAHRKLEQLREPKAAKSWLFQILRTAFFKLCRKRRPSTEADVEMDIESALIHDPQEAEPHYDRELLQARLNELPDNYRAALLMFYFEEMSYEEISKALDIPMGTVMSRLSRAKACLRSRAHDIGGNR